MPNAGLAAFSRSTSRADAATMTPADVFATIRYVAAHADVPQAEAAATITALALARPSATLDTITADAIARLRAAS